MLTFFLILSWILSIFMGLFFARAVFSWLFAFNIINVNNDLVKVIDGFLQMVTEPILRPIRRVVPPFGTVDVSPIIAILTIFLLRILLFSFV